MSGPLQVLVDGAPVTADWPLDRSLQYGDGLFETLTVRGGRLRFEALHRARLAGGCRRLALSIDSNALWQTAGELAAAHVECTLKVLVSRGSTLARGYTPPPAATPRVMHLVYPPPAAGEIPTRVRLATLQAVLGENPALAGLKHCNRLEQVLGRQLQHLDRLQHLRQQGEALFLALAEAGFETHAVEGGSAGAFRRDPPNS